MDNRSKKKDGSNTKQGEKKFIAEICYSRLLLQEEQSWTETFFYGTGLIMNTGLE